MRALRLLLPCLASIAVFLRAILNWGALDHDLHGDTGACFVELQDPPSKKGNKATAGALDHCFEQCFWLTQLLSFGGTT